MGVGANRQDFAEFYRRSKDECLFTVLVSVGDRDTAQDLVAEAFARAWASWRTVSRHPAPAWCGRARAAPEADLKLARIRSAASAAAKASRRATHAAPSALDASRLLLMAGAPFPALPHTGCYRAACLPF